MQYLQINFLPKIALSIVVLGVLFFGFTYHASAQATGITGTIELDGYAWSSTIGWISLNCKTGGVIGNNICTTSNYSVRLSTTGMLYGFAWSSNIGWIKFDGLSNYPIDAGNQGIGNVASNNPARATGTYPNLTFAGWARACAGTLSAPGTCSDNNSRTDGWDGWIALRGTNHTVQMNAAGMVSNSYAWGGSVVGWVDMFSRVLLLTPANISGAGCLIPVGSGTCNGRIDWNIGSSVTTPRVFNLTRSSVVASTQNGVNQSISLQHGPNIIELRDNVTPLGSATTLTATCANPTSNQFNVASNTCQARTATSTAPTIDFEIVPKIVRKGGSVTANWTITPAQPTGCVLSGPGVLAANSNLTTEVGRLTIPVNNPSIFSIVCTGVYGTVTETVRVEVVPTAQEV